MLQFVTTSTSALAKKSFPTFPKLKKDERRVITFLNQIKEFNPKHESADSPVFVDAVSYFDSVSRTYFRFSDSVSDAVKRKVLSKESVKENKKVLCNLLTYVTDNKGVITDIEGLYIGQLGREKVSSFDEILNSARMDNPNASLYNMDFRIKCEEEGYQKWTITATNSKFFAKLSQDVQKAWLDQGKEYITELFDKVSGKPLEEDEVIEKFGLVGMGSDVHNPMASGESDEDFSNIKISTPFKK